MPSSVLPRSVPMLLLALLSAQPATSWADPPEALRSRLMASFPEHAAVVLGTHDIYGFEEHGGAYVARAEHNRGLPYDPEEDLAGRGSLQLSLPRTAGEDFLFELAGGFAVAVRQLGLRGHATAVDNALAYGADGTFVFWTATPAGYEQWLLLSAAQQGVVARYQVTGADPVQRGDVVDILDEEGQARITVRAPRAYAANGDPVHVWLDADPELGLITLSIDPLQNRGAVLVDPQWIATDSLNTGRQNATATLLADGRVLVAGGTSIMTGYLASAEIFDPRTFTWMSTPDMPEPRTWHTATLLRNGKVLVAGGYGDYGLYLDTSALYDPATNSWTSTGNLATGARYYHTATLLPDGRVLVAGGYSSGAYLKTAEIYDPEQGTWSSTGQLATTRFQHAATSLSDGKVLVVGGKNSAYLASAEKYDPSSGTWSSAGSMAAARYLHTVTRAPDGSVVVMGGYNSSQGYLGSIEIYENDGTWSQPGVSLSYNRYRHAAILLPSGRILAMGGYSSSYGYTTAVESFDSVSRQVSSEPSLLNGRVYHFAALLATGQILLGGGYTPGGGEAGYAAAHLYDPSVGATAEGPLTVVGHDTHTATMLLDGRVLVAGGYPYSTATETYDGGGWTSVGSLGVGRRDHTATLLPSGQVLVAGGRGSSGTLADCRLFNPSLSRLVCHGRTGSESC